MNIRFWPRYSGTVFSAALIASALAQAAAASPPKTAAEAETATDSANTLPPLVLSPSAANAASALALPSPNLPPAEAEAETEAPADSPAASPPIADEECDYNKGDMLSADPKTSCPFTRAQKITLHEIGQAVAKNERKCDEATERGLNGQERWQYEFERRKYDCMLKDSPELVRKSAELEDSKQVDYYKRDPFIVALTNYGAGANRGICKQEWHRFETKMELEGVLERYGIWAERKAPKFIAHKYDISEADQLGLRTIVRGTGMIYDQDPQRMCLFAEDIIWSFEPGIDPGAISAFASYHAVISRGEDPEMPGDDSADERGAQP